MISSLEFYLLVLFIVLAAINVSIAIRYEKYLKQGQNKLSYLHLAKKFAEDHPVIGKVYLYSAYLMLSVIPTLFLLMILKSFKLN